MTRRQRSGLAIALLLALAAGWLGSEALRGRRSSESAGPAGEDAREQEIATLKDRVAALEHEAAALRAGSKPAVLHGSPARSGAPPAPHPSPDGGKPKSVPPDDGEAPA